jgi:hypothetical protein
VLPAWWDYRPPSPRALASRWRRPEKEVAARRDDVEPHELVAGLRRLGDEIANRM